MKTDDLVSLLATGVQAVDIGAPRRRFRAAVAVAAALAVMMTAAWLGVRPTLIGDFVVPMFWAKEAFCAVLAAAGLVAVFRLARPGAMLGRLVPVFLAAPLAGMWLIAAAALSAADAQGRSKLILGLTADVCPFRIAVIAVPLFVAIFRAMRGLAPTRLRLAGAAGGFAAGAVGALVYSLHCAELAAPFIGIWYVLGILIPTAAGTLLGPYLLRW